jgi:hypothetical protein
MGFVHGAAARALRASIAAAQRAGATRATAASLKEAAVARLLDGSGGGAGAAGLAAAPPPPPPPARVFIAPPLVHELFGGLAVEGGGEGGAPARHALLPLPEELGDELTALFAAPALARATQIRAIAPVDVAAVLPSLVPRGWAGAAEVRWRAASGTASAASAASAAAAAAAASAASAAAAAAAPSTAPGAHALPAARWLARFWT